ncbi:MAG: efflux RND transporter permease subunit [Thermodesulfobacteriota bacterium]
MFLSNLSIKRPIFATMMMLALVILGIFSYRKLAIDMFPDVEIPVLSIVTVFPGASPETVEREVTKRIEEVVNRISGAKHVMSISRESVSQVVVEFHLEVKINEASQDARAKINTIRRDLPQDIEEPVIQKMDVGSVPIVSLAVRSEKLSARELTTLVEKKVKRRFENISGVGKVELVGTSKREVNIWIDPIRLQALNMGVDEVIAGLQSENVNIPLGRLNRDNSEFTLRIAGKPDEIEQFKTMVIGQRGGRPILLSEVADVRDGMEEQRSLALINGVPAVSLNILKQTKTNTVEVADRIKKTIGQLQKELPGGTAIDIVQDSSVFIRDSVRDVNETLIIGAILTILIVFCFLNSWRSTVITGLTLPISVISSFIIMNFLGMTINVMTMMALSLAIGLLIDDAIVVRENIVRHLERGQDHFEAAREGTSEIGLAVLATSLSIIAVFVPVAFMKGIAGRFFFQFGMTVAFAVMVSLFVSFTLDPMLSSRWTDPDIHRLGRRNWLYRGLDQFNRGFEWLAERYKLIIAWALDRRKTMMTITVLTFVAGLMLFSRLPGEFFPSFDAGEFQLNFKTAPGASIEESRGRVAAVLTSLKQLPEIKHTYTTIGAGDTGTVRDVRMYIKLKERSERSRSQFEVQEDIRRRCQDIAGIQPSIQQAQGMDERKPLIVSIRGDDIVLLKKYAAQLKEKMTAIQGIVDLDVTLEHDIPEYRLIVDRERAVDSGLMTANIVRTVGALVGGRAVSTYEDEDGDAVNLRVRLPREFRQDPEQVKQLRMTVLKPGQPPALVPLGELVSYQRSATPSEITRQDLSREVALSANLDKLAIGSAMNQIKEAMKDMSLAPGYQVVFSGEGEAMVETFGYMAEALILAILMVYLILASQFESFIDPLAIMLSLPLSLVGMAGMLYLTGDTQNMMSLIGLIMLMGLVTKNAILLVDYTKVLRSRGLARREAIITAGRTRLRPIMMTTMAMIFGMLPLALALGAGAEMRAPMARAVIGGLITSTFLTLLVVPVVYSLLDDFSAWVRRRREKKKEVLS